MPAGYDAEVAELFRDLRAASGLTEADLAAQLATRLDVVQALEQGAIFALPPWPETCRVVSTYGTLLNLDVRPLLRRIYAQVEAGIVELAPKPMPDVPFMAPPEDMNRDSGSRARPSGLRTSATSRFPRHPARPAARRKGRPSGAGSPSATPAGAAPSAANASAAAASAADRPPQPQPPSATAATVATAAPRGAAASPVTAAAALASRSRPRQPQPQCSRRHRNGTPQPRAAPQPQPRCGATAATAADSRSHRESGASIGAGRGEAGTEKAAMGDLAEMGPGPR